MNDLISYERNLPENIEDVAKFVVIGAEKLNALRAEIRAIKKASIAKEVYDQKLEEQRRLSELILDAAVKVGEFTKQLPKKIGARTDVKPTDSDVARLCETKGQAIEKLGFSYKQVERFEKLADNKDIVEQVKAQAREEGTSPTRTEVLRRVKERDNITSFTDLRQNKVSKDFRKIEEEHKIYKQFINSVFSILSFDDADSQLRAVVAADGNLPETIEYIENAITKLSKIKQRLILKGAKLCQEEPS